MSPIKELFSSLSDLELGNLISEMKESDQTGIVGDLVRELTRKVSKITNAYLTADMLTTQMSILKEAAFRWQPSTNKN